MTAAIFQSFSLESNNKVCWQWGNVLWNEYSYNIHNNLNGAQKKHRRHGIPFGTMKFLPSFHVDFFESSLEHVVSSCEQQVVDSLTKRSNDFTRYDDKVYLNLILCKDNSLGIFLFSIFNFLKRAKLNPLSKKD